MANSMVFILLCCAITGTHSARILAVFPTPSVSHQVVLQPLTLELAKRGHELTVITAYPLYASKNPENYTEIDVYEVSYEHWKKKVVHNIEFGTKKSIYPQMETLLSAMTEVICLQIKHPKIQRIIKDREKYDLLLLEAWSRQTLVYSHLFQAPVIQISSLGSMFGRDEGNVGAPKHPFLFPMTISQKLYNHTFWDKIEELRFRLWFDRFFYAEESNELEILREKISNDLPNYDILSDNIDMLFINSHPMWINNQPLPPNVKTIWGIYKNPERVLPKLHLIQLPNVTIEEGDKREHPKIKLFITQGGLQSTDEAISAGVPMIGIPMLGDQWFNVEKYVLYKIGIKIEMETITEEELEEAIQTIINDTSYRDNIVRLRKLMNDQPQGALERAVWWTEYVLRHGGAKHLRAAGANMHWTKYYEIEFVLQLFSIVFVALVTSLLVVYFVWKQLSIPKRHPKIMLFITQGGLQSTDEAMDAGVPLIGIPMLGYQSYNVEQYEYHKIGVKLDLEILTEEKLFDAINAIIYLSYPYLIKRIIVE
ncbi:unnamed protein product [Leptosia nina]|uniref:Ecdysteroid UDP-glucosyltransferase n=1 Tax=Leptosia nina TaxID=320188 RepID=A0AAV1JEB0_9NEOP